MTKGWSMRRFILLLPLLAAGCVTDEPAGGVTFRVEATGLPHGIHGIHVHSVGRCEGPDFASAGPHWNPAGRKHGLSNPAGPHAGDLPNVEVAANGVLGATLVLPGTNL